MNISDEAVEAAAKAIAQVETGDDGVTAANDIDRIFARAALEAAAPYLIATLVASLDRWAGRSKSGFYDEAQDDVVQILNPYRSQA